MPAAPTSSARGLPLSTSGCSEAYSSSRRSVSSVRQATASMRLAVTIDWLNRRPFRHPHPGRAAFRTAAFLAGARQDARLD